MTAFYKSSVLLLLVLGQTPLFTQSIPEQTDAISGSFKGVALDVFPVLNEIFSDDPSNEAFTINYIWGRERFQYEVGLSPQFSRTNSESDDPVLKTFGLDFRFFHGKTKTVATRWFVTFGMTYEYQYTKEVSKSQGTFDFSFTTTGHTGGLGPQLIFGYRMADQIWLRSRTAGLLQYTSIKTKIKDGSIEASGQEIDVLGFEIKPPTILELVYIF